MSGQNGQSVFDILTGGWRRTVSEMNSKGTLGVSIPVDVREKYDIQKGDEVAITEPEGRDGVLELHFE